MNIDEALRALCEKHGLDRIDVGFRAKWGANTTVWWNDGHSCMFGNGGTCADALADAISSANEARTIAPEIPALEIGEIEA